MKTKFKIDIEDLTIYAKAKVSYDETFSVRFEEIKYDISQLPKAYRHHVKKAFIGESVAYDIDILKSIFELKAVFDKSKKLQALTLKLLNPLKIDATLDEALYIMYNPKAKKNQFQYKGGSLSLGDGSGASLNVFNLQLKKLIKRPQFQTWASNLITALKETIFKVK